MQKLLTSIFVILTLLSFCAEAQQNTSQLLSSDKIISVDCPREVVNLYRPLSQKLILAMFGKQASIKSLSLNGITKQQQELVLGMTNSSVSSCVSPFPSETANTVKAILYYLYLITLGLWTFMFSLFAFDSAYLAQSKGEKNNTTSDSPVLKGIRAILAMFITVPIVHLITEDSKDFNFDSSAYSFLHEIMFIGFGKSISVAEDIDIKMKQNQESSNPTYKIPEPDFPLKIGTDSIMTTKGNTGVSAILDFGYCAVAANGGKPIKNSDLKFSFFSGNKYRMDVSFSKNGTTYCSGKIEMMSDIETSEIFIKLGFDNDYYFQKERLIFSSLSKSLLSLSLGYAEGLAENINSSATGISDGDLPNPEISNLKLWTEACPLTRKEARKVAKKYSLNANGELSTSSISAMRALSEKCEAYIITAKLAYPKRFDGDTVKSINKFVEDEFKFDAAVFTKTKKNGVMEPIYPKIYQSRKLAARQYQTCSYSNDNGEKKDLNSCFKSVCDLVNPEDPVSGIFECSLLAHKIDSSYISNFYDSLGFIATPISMMSRMGMSHVASSPQALIGSVNATMSGQLNRKADNYDIFRDMTKIDLLEKNKRLKMEDASYMDSKNNDPLFGVPDQFQQCLMHPSSIIKHKNIWGQEYFTVCEHPINEVHSFGVFLLRLYSAFASGIALKHSQPLVNKFINKRKEVKKIADGELNQSEEYGIKTSNRKSNSKNSLIRKMIIGLSAYAGLGVAEPLLGMVLNGASGAASGFIPPFMNPFLGGTMDETPYWNDPRTAFNGFTAMSAVALGYLISGNVILKNGNKKIEDVEKRAIEHKTKNLSLISFFMLSTGFVAAFIVPLAPAAIFYAALITTLANLLAMVFSANFHVLYALANTGKDIRKKMTTLFNKWILLILRLPLLVVGFHLSYSLMSIVLPSMAGATSSILKFAGLSVNLFGELNVASVLMGLFGWLLFLFLYMIVMYATFDAITAPFELSRGLVFNDDSGEVFGKSDSHSKIKENIRLFKGI